MQNTVLNKVLKASMLIMVFGTFIGIGIDEFVRQTQSNVLIFQNSEAPIQSGFGKITLGDYKNAETMTNPNLKYVDNTLGFTISRPDLTWDFDTDLSQIKEIENNLRSETFLGGMFVEQQDNQMFFVGVFDISKLGNFTLTNYVQTQSSFMEENHNAKIYPMEISKDNTWALFGITVMSKERQLYGEQILEIRNNKLFMIQYTGSPPSVIDEKKGKDILHIIDSFTIM